MISILAFILMLGAVIFIHELGHFVMAKRAGILCHEFAIGMGPILYSKKKGETTYSLRAIPIGGFVMMAGEEVNDELVKVDQEVRLLFDEQGKVTHIVLDALDPRYQDALLVRVSLVDLKGKDNQALYLNEYEVNRDAYYVMKNKELQIAPYERSFESKTLLERFLTIFMGPFMNFLLALVLFFVIALMRGLPQMTSSEIGSVPIISDEIKADPDVYNRYLNSNLFNHFEVGDEILSIAGEDVSDFRDVNRLLNKHAGNRNLDIVINRNGTEMTKTVTPIVYIYSIGVHSTFSDPEGLMLNVLANFPAYEAGLRTGDKIVSIDGNSVSDWASVLALFEANKEGSSMVIQVERDGTLQSVMTVNPFDENFLSGQRIDFIRADLGIGPVHERQFFASFGYGFSMVIGTITMIFATLGSLFSGTISVNMLAGPVGIASMTADAVAAGLIVFLSWSAMLSINLGIINLLPIPALDGGRLVFLGYEAVARRPVNKRVENTLHFVMFILLIALFVYITFNDITRLFTSS